MTHARVGVPPPPDLVMQEGGVVVDEGGEGGGAEVGGEAEGKGHAAVDQRDAHLGTGGVTVRR